VAANGFGDHFFTQTQPVHLLTSLLELIDQPQDEATGVRRLDERRNSIQKESALSKFAQSDP
jgi:hypothetical protein